MVLFIGSLWPLCGICSIPTVIHMENFSSFEGTLMSPKFGWNCSKLNKSQKINFRNMMIFISYTMYFDPIRTMVNFKNRMYVMQGVFWPKMGRNRVILRKVRLLNGFRAKIHLEWNKLNFEVHHRSYHVEIHRKRYKDHHISKIYFFTFI